LAISPTAPSTPSQIQQVGPFDLEVTRLRVFIKEGRPQAHIEAPLGDSCNSLQQITQPQRLSRDDDRERRNVMPL
jgi:hypothetical protein